MGDGDSKGKKRRRSSHWYGESSMESFIHRSWMKNQGHPPHMFDGRPIIGICNTYSELTPCNAHLRELVDHVRRGVLEAGGFPLEFPVFSCAETNLRPTAMLYRNLASMDVEESLRGLPIDGTVLMTGCDKTTPSLLMGAASCDLPAIAVSGGPMLNGVFQNKKIGSGTAVWMFDQKVKAGEMDMCEFMQAEAALSRSAGHCMTMGTASTMNSMAEALGVALPMNSAIPAVDARRRTLCQEAGRRIVDLVERDVRMSQILTKDAFENAIRANAAIGGSTNAVIHLIAVAGRIGVELDLDDWDRLGRDVPTIVNLMPSGEHLMEDFYYAGGLPAVMRALGEAGLLHRESLTVNGNTVWDNCKDAPNHNKDVIRDFDDALTKSGGIAVLRGNLAPDGAVLKPSAASPGLLRHKGRAVVFESIEQYKEQITDDSLDVDEDCILVLKGCGPRGYPGMAEVGNMGLPPKVLKKGVTDMVRISDARMSGTAYGTVVLHTCPEAAVGGPLALVESGDMIELDVEARRLELLVDEKELEARRKRWKEPEVEYRGGYVGLYVRHVMQADKGADLDFLVGCRGHEVPKRDSH